MQIFKQQYTYGKIRKGKGKGILTFKLSRQEY